MAANRGSSQIGTKRTAGRPRSEASRQAILNAAFSLLEHKRIAEITTVDIAREARVSSATVYRWWRRKEAILIEAFLHKTGHELVIPTRGTPLNRLRDHILQIVRFFIGKNGAVVARLVAAIQDDPALRKRFAEQIFSPRRREAQELVREAIREHQLPAGTDVDLLLGMLFGPLLLRLLLDRDKLTEAIVRKVFDLGIAGAKAARAR